MNGQPKKIQNYEDKVIMMSLLVRLDKGTGVVEHWTVQSSVQSASCLSAVMSHNSHHSQITRVELDNISLLYTYICL